MLTPKLSSEPRRGPSDQSRVLGTDRKTTPIISIIGTSNSGKTTLLERVIKELKSRGFRVAVIKHAHHGFDIDQPGKDSWRLAQAGSDIVVISSPNKVAIIEQADAELTLAQIKMRFEEKVDIVLAEGYKNSEIAKIIVLSEGQYKEQFSCQGVILARVWAQLSASGVPQFEYEDIVSITNLLTKQMSNNSPMDSETSFVAEVSKIVCEVGG